MFRVKHLIAASLLSCVFFLFPSVAPAQEPDPKFVALARTLAQRIEKRLPTARGDEAATGYLVFDFRREPGGMTQLGVHLADELSDALKNELPGLKLVERSKLRDLCEREALDVALLGEDETALWVARELGARLAIVGTVELKGGSSFLLHVRAVGDNGEQVTDAGEFLEWTEERRTLDLAGVERPPTRSRWENVPRAGQNGYAYPECVHCPNPAYTEAARKARVQGTITAEVLIGEDGHVQQVRLLRGLPHGLTISALATFKTWQFKPIRGPDGRPAVVQSPVEVTFRLT